MADCKFFFLNKNRLSYRLRQRQWIWRNWMMIVELLIGIYFRAGFKYEEIIELLKRCHKAEFVLFFWMPCNALKMYSKWNECFKASCLTKILILFVLMPGGKGHWDVVCAMIKVPTRYDMLMVMISLSSLGLRSTDALMDTVDAYFGWTF